MAYRIEKLLVAGLALAFVWVLPLRLQAQGASELRAFNAAVAEFEDGSFVLAEKELADFIRTFPESARRPEAILYQAQAALKLQKFKAAAGLLSTNATAAGPLADQYRYF